MSQLTRQDLYNPCKVPAREDNNSIVQCYDNNLLNILNGLSSGSTGGFSTEIYEIGEIDFNDMNTWIGDKDADFIFENIQNITGQKLFIAFYAKTVQDFVQDSPYTDLFGVDKIGFDGANMSLNGTYKEINSMLDSFNGTTGGTMTSYQSEISFGGSSGSNQMLNNTRKDVRVRLRVIPTGSTNSGSWTSGLMKIYAEVRSIPTLP